ncbi:MAG: NAD(P)-dependent oxidoreductase [Defluviitaleaceae bacterium]|nr:NAD(P)-dependent oxidoreductase [Defluviitaleaceae bacterium]
MNKVVITGVSGFVGMATAQYLLKKNVKVIGIDKKNIPLRHYNFEFLELNLAENVEVESAALLDADVLYHFAWSGVNADVRNDYPIQIKNIQMSLNTLVLAKSQNIKKVIMLGSASEYVRSGEVINGYNLPNPIDAYGASKCAAYLFCKTYAEQNNINFVGIIATSIYGPGRDDNNIISYTIKALLRKEKPSFTLLEQKWDFIFIKDFLHALYLLGLSGKSGKNYTVASGSYRLLHEYVEIIRDCIDSNLPLGIGEKPYKAGKVEHAIFDINDIIYDTGFKPEYSFEGSIISVIEYFRTLGNY